MRDIGKRARIVCHKTYVSIQYGDAKNRSLECVVENEKYRR